MSYHCNKHMAFSCCPFEMSDFFEIFENYLKPERVVHVFVH